MTKKYPIQNEYDYLVAETQAEVEIARGIHERARAAQDYHKEKVAAKLVAFYEAKLGFVALYVEIKQNYPELIEVIDQENPSFALMLAEAKRSWEGQHNP
jgi:hypothetical protein